MTSHTEQEDLESQPLAKVLVRDGVDLPETVETEFERPRGISEVEVRPGYAQVYAGLSEGASTEEALELLDAVAQKSVSIDFLKLTATGISFVCKEDQAEAVKEALAAISTEFQITDGRCILYAYAVNMRDEAGLIARIVAEAIGTGAVIDHVSDMHDRVLIVTDQGGSELIKSRIEEKLMGELD